MAFKTGIFSLALSALLLGTTASAQDTQAPEVNTQQNFAAGAEVQGFHGGGYNEPSYHDDHDNRGRYDRDDRRDWERRRDRRGHIEVHIHSGSCRHGPQPAHPQYQQGRYEIRLVQQWVAGRYEQVWVPEQCHYKPRRHVTKCKGGYYDQRWVPGRYETVEQWVWVPSSWERRGHDSSPASYWN